MAYEQRVVDAELRQLLCATGCVVVEGPKAVGKTETSRQIVDALDLDQSCARTDVVDCNLRWVLLHLIEETARHAGHADLIRETLDGSRGV